MRYRQLFWCVVSILLQGWAATISGRTDEQAYAVIAQLYEEMAHVLDTTEVAQYTPEMCRKLTQKMHDAAAAITVNDKTREHSVVVDRCVTYLRTVRIRKGKQGAYNTLLRTCVLCAYALDVLDGRQPTYDLYTAPSPQEVHDAQCQVAQAGDALESAPGGYLWEIVALCSGGVAFTAIAGTIQAFGSPASP